MRTERRYLDKEILDHCSWEPSENFISSLIARNIDKLGWDLMRRSLVEKYTPHEDKDEKPILMSRAKADKITFSHNHNANLHMYNTYLHICITFDMSIIPKNYIYKTFKYIHNTLRYL